MMGSTRDILYCRKFVLKYNAFLVIYKQMCVFLLDKFPKAVSHLLSQFCHPGYISTNSFAEFLRNYLTEHNEPGHSTRLEDLIFKDS